MKPQTAIHICHGANSLLLYASLAGGRQPLKLSHQRQQLSLLLRGCFPARQRGTHQATFISSLPVLSWKNTSIWSPSPLIVTESNPQSSGSLLTQWLSNEEGIPRHGSFCDALLRKPVNGVPPLAPAKSQRETGSVLQLWLARASCHYLD